ncbi:MAG: DUF4384 domain-containing protein [Muribaculaceae bacterium]|nr:DUF4384 domain-containing protein [Muribaculaceae bacterium]
MRQKLIIPLLYLILHIVGAGMVWADEKVTAKGEYYAPLSMPPAQARQEAIYRAQVDAIRKAYGTSVAETSLSIQSEGESSARDSYYSIGECDVRGEWIETIGEPIWKIVPGERETYYEVTLKGVIREIPGGRADLDVRLLSNGTDKDRDWVRDATFRVGDYFYLYFKSPVDGYLACYLGDDDEAMSMQCLVPYDGMREGCFPVEAGKEYILFSREDAEEPLRTLTRRLKMNARNETDINQVYVIFSPNKFIKASDSSDLSKTVIDSKTGEEVSLMPRATDFLSFQKWLSKQRKRDKDLQIVKSLIVVKH